MLTNLVYVFLGGGIGSVLRFGISLLMMSLGKSIFPAATLISNVLSCLVLGLTVFFLGEKFSSEMSIRMLMITGFCGGFSTFSAFSYETIGLVRSGDHLYAVLNVVISMALCLGIIYIFTRSQA